ncbi:hypothetical protein [Curtobacterium sp. 1544]|uniref:hypothetical protein n=1 Tax=Curtobacterium sp. 1544 TaxID=3156417 RepID=UPI003393DC9A
MVMGARVTIDGTEVASTWNGADAVALDGLRITWGRGDPYDETEPGTLSASIIDPTGRWSSDQTLAGRTIEVARTSGTAAVVMFRGKITRAALTRRKVSNPATGSREPVWIVSLSAGDTLATAAATILSGEMGDGSVEGLGGWGEQAPGTRLSNAMARGGSAVFTDRDPIIYDVLGNGTVHRWMHGTPASEQWTLLDLLAQAYKLSPLGVVGYDPDTGVAKLCNFAAASNIVLVYTNQTVTLQLPSGRVIDAAKVALPDDSTVETTAAEAIDTVQLSYYWYGKDPNVSGGTAKRVTYTNPFIQRTTARGLASGTNRVLKVDTWAMYLDPSEYAAGAVDSRNRFIGWLADQVTSIVNSLNGQLRMPTVRFDDKRLPLDAAATDAIYRPLQSTTPLYFAGSMFNVLENAGPQYQIIGGTLTYNRGWTHDVNVCAARSLTTPDLTIAQLFGTTTPAQLGQFDASIRLGDLATVTQGL